jgi:hypothetical protein
MPDFNNTKDFEAAIKEDLAAKLANLSGEIGAAAVDGITQASQKRLPPPEIIAASSNRVRVGYVQPEEVKKAKKEEAMGTRPIARTVNAFRADLAGILRKRGIKGLKK